MHWTDKYVGLRYSEDFDCGHLVSKIEEEHFGKKIIFPARISPRLDDLTHEIIEEKDNFAVQIDTPVDGDGVLMQTGRFLHIGVYFQRNGIGWVIHNSKGAGGTVINRINDLGRFGMVLLGYYEFITNESS